MPAKKPPQKPASKKEQKSSPAITARIDRLVDYEGSNVRAIASVNVADAFAIHGLKVIDSEKGLFVSMPQSKYEKDGKTQYSDICHPITAEARTEMFGTVLAAYEQKLQEDVQMEPGEALETGQAM
ncbi:MAG: SpoVG family protein [Schaedlerella sp.]|uniref:SpoVG family protein n=1 Tax=Schaedlerella sp. TaxID=2676057 RepID=UPI0035273132